MLVTLGFALGLLRERTGGILAPVLVHALFNAANVAMTLGSPGAPPR
jgi:membrane protease YdiL (CAAX protease family)